MPKATTYKNQWALSVFREWQQKRDKKWPSFEFGGLFKANEIGSEIQIVSTAIEDMTTLSLNYWLSKFANKSGGHYPSRTLYGLVCGLKRYLGNVHGGAALNPLDITDKR